MWRRREAVAGDRRRSKSRRYEKGSRVSGSLSLFQSGRGRQVVQADPLARGRSGVRIPATPPTVTHTYTTVTHPLSIPRRGGGGRAEAGAEERRDASSATPSPVMVRPAMEMQQTDDRDTFDSAARLSSSLRCVAGLVAVAVETDSESGHVARGRSRSASMAPSG